MTFSNGARLASSIIAIAAAVVYFLPGDGRGSAQYLFICAIWIRLLGMDAERGA
jgi:hypothetical protein